MQTVASFWRRYAEIYLMLWRNSVVREMSFKANFILWIFVEGLWFALQLAFMMVIYRHTDQIATWSKYEVVMLVGTSQVIQQLFTAIFFTNCVELSEHVRTGRLDFMLLLPMNTRFLISFRKVDLGGFINAAGALAVVAYGAKQLELHPSWTQFVGYATLVVAALLIHYSLMLILVSTSFFTVRSQGIVWGYYNLFNIARLPDAAFKGIFRAVFTFVLPMLLVSNVPTKLLAEKLGSPLEIALLLGMSGALLGLSEVVWRACLKRYTSASS
ncbi:MAG TPA: ABC-2 family transporter protein [Methylomirabilota bacterium]|nr:ABC-2 family transporter protein [Methylomirabilota bacterium]